MCLLPRDTALGRLAIDEVFDYYDGPRLFTCTNGDGRTFVALWIDEDEVASRWLYLGVSRERLDELRHAALDLRGAFLRPEGGSVSEVTVPADGAASLREVPAAAVDASVLPDPGECLEGSKRPTPRVSERAFEDAVEAGLLERGFRRRLPGDYHRGLCLLPRDLLDFIWTTQPREWKRLEEHHGSEVKERFLARLSREIERRGVLDVLRKGVKDSGCKFRLAYYQPSSGLNEELRRLYEGNLLAVVRQLRYSEREDNKSLDIALFLNGVPVFTGELKNPLTGQSVQDAIRQYCLDRDPREPLLAFRRCLAHFAVDPDLVYVTTRLDGRSTRFLPFNQGKYRGAGNPPAPPSTGGYATSYLWERVWARDSFLDLVQHFIHEYEEEDEKGKRAGKQTLIFPRYHQLDAVRRLIEHAREHGPGRRYLIQHSAGSGKSNSIAWLAHRLSTLHDAADRRVFDSIVVVTDRRVLDRQLQRTVRQFEQTAGVVENIDTTSRKLKEALESGKTIIVTTLQKFPVIAEEIGALPGKRFAVIIDEAHSSQSGESTRSLKAVLAAGSLEEAAAEDAGEPEDLEDRIVAAMKTRGQLPNVSSFAFTATPKAKTLELFGTRRPDGTYEAFSLYSMRQAIEERFILDVLANYATYKVYWKLLKKVEEDPRYEKGKASYLLRSFVDLHEHAVAKKVEIMVEHFHGTSARRIGGQAKAMIVTRSRLHAVRYKLAIDRHLKERGYPYRALVAFSGSVRDGGADFTEAGMNGFPEAQTAEVFKRPEFRFLVVANKFQTGFDQPLLHTMYVDKKLGGVNAVQTLSRLNRIHPDKEEAVVLDFANEAEEIQKAFEPYSEKTLLPEGTDPNLLYDVEGRILAHPVCGPGDIEAFARLYFNPKSTQDQLYAALAPWVERFGRLPEEEKADFRRELTDFVRLYAFLSQVISFTDADLEKFYVAARFLRRCLPAERDELPREVQEKIDMESYRIRQTFKGGIKLERGDKEVPPVRAIDDHPHAAEAVEALSQIIRDLNERFGTDFSEEDRVFIEHLEERLFGDDTLRNIIRVNTPENARLAFDHVVDDRLQELVDTNFKFYKRVTEDPAFAKHFLDWLFERFRRSVAE